MSEDEIRKLDELAQRMNKTRSDIIRDLITKFDEALRQEVERESKKWLAIGFVSALESMIIGPEVIVRFVRRNVDVLGYPDFVIGMVRVRNRIVVFSHHDRIGSQLLNLVRSRIEEEVKREEMEIEQEDVEGEGVDGGGSPRVRVSRPIRPSAPHAAPGTSRYKIVISNKSATPIPRPTAPTTVGRSVVSNGGSGAKAAVAAAVAENKKLVVASQPNTGNPVNSQPRNPNPQASADGSGKDSQKPAGQGITHGLSGDFVVSLITNLYHKHREALLKAVEDVMGG
jgi:hypothetical protein